MPNLLLPVNTPTVLTQNVTYALPAQLSFVTGSGALETSMDGTTWAAFTSGGMCGAPFIRSGAVGTIVTCK